MTTACPRAPSGKKTTNLSSRQNQHIKASMNIPNV